MLRSLKSLLRHSIRAQDGEAGKVRDFLFDDQSWSIRYVIAEIRGRVHGRRVLIPSIVLGSVSPDDRYIPVELTAEEVRSSPDAGSAETVSGQYRLALSHCQFLPHRWMADPVNVGPSISPAEFREIALHETTGINLRSAREVVTYHVVGLDGEIGSTADFVVDDASWVIRHIVVRTGFWIFAKRAPLSSGCVEGLSWLSKRVEAVVTRDCLNWRATWTTPA